MSIDRLRAHYGFSRMPFGKELAPQALFRSKGHAEAVARISWLVAERGIGLVTGEVGAGKTVAARAATAALDRDATVSAATTVTGHPPRTRCPGSPVGSPGPQQGPRGQRLAGSARHDGQAIGGSLPLCGE